MKNYKENQVPENSQITEQAPAEELKIDTKIIGVIESGFFETSEQEAILSSLKKACNNGNKEGLQKQYAKIVSVYKQRSAKKPEAPESNPIAEDVKKEDLPF